MKLVEPPSCSPAASTIVFIGRNHRGNWVAREQNGLFGGLFVSRAQAVKYALFENGNHPETIVELSREVELDILSQATDRGCKARGLIHAASPEEDRMAESRASDREQVVDTMIALTRASNPQGVIVAGDESMEFCLSLRRRGFTRISTPATCPVSRRQHAVGLITGRNPVTALAQASAFLSDNSAIAVLIESREGEFCMAIRHKLQQMGFRIEAGVRCQRGLVLSACRLGFAEMENAA